MDIANIQVEPCRVSWGGTDLGFTDGDLETKLDEKGVAVTAHQEGTNELDMIRIGKSVEIAVNLKETTIAQVRSLLNVGGDSFGGTAEVTNVTCIADVAGSLNNKFFFIYGESGAAYCVWINVDSTGVDPSIPGFTSVPVAISADDSADTVADAVASALDGLADFAAPNPGAAVVTCTNASDGPRTAPDAGNSGFTLLVTLAGASDLVGWGKTKDFTSMLGDSQGLVLHPVVRSDVDKTADLNFWKAYPMIGSITNSGEKEKSVKVTFKIFPDASKDDAVRLFGYGDGS